MGRIDTSKINKVIGNHITSDTVLSFDAWKSYETFAFSKGIDHYVINASKGHHKVKNMYHIQNVNSYHSRLKNWIERFNGVASKYLENYLTWSDFVENKRFCISVDDRKDMLFKSCHYKINETVKSIYKDK